MSMPRLVAAAGAAVLCALPVLAEDLTIVYKTTGHGGPGTSTTYFSAEKMRTSDAERDTIIEYGPGRIVSIDHKKKEYSEITLAEMEAAMKAAAAQMEQATAQMQQQMANMPPAMREKMEAMMGGGAGAVTVTKGTTRKVAGYDCQNYDVKMAATMDMVVCASTAIKPPGAERRPVEVRVGRRPGRGPRREPHVQGHGQARRGDEEDPGLLPRRSRRRSR